MAADLDWVARIWLSLDEKDKRMVVARAEGRTLDDIGHEYGLTRERIRQLVRKAHDGLAAAGETLCPDWPERVWKLAENPAVSRSELAKVLGTEDHIAVDALAATAGLVTPRTWAGPLRGWWTAQPGELNKRLCAVADQAPFQSGEVARVARAAGIPDGIPLRQLMADEDSPLVPGADDRWLRRRARRRDAAYLWLLEKGEPLLSEELVEPTGIHTAHAVRESLRRDDRFVNIRPTGTWGLTEWSHLRTVRYSNAVDAVVAVVTEFGPISKEALFAKVIELYPVSTWRLNQCLLSDLVGKTAAGLIDLSSRGATPIEENEPSKPTTMAVDTSGKVFGVRLTVNSEILRGSGIAINSWLTWQLGLRQAPMSKTFDMGERYAPITVRRATVQHRSPLCANRSKTSV